MTRHAASSLVRSAAALGLAGLLALAPQASAAAQVPAASTTGGAIFDVGAASVTINPTYPVYLGGYGGGQDGGTVLRHVDPLTGQRENFTVRALSIAAGGHVVELARVDSQGWFAGYQEGPYGISDVRSAVASFLQAHGFPGATSASILVSSLHEHASPTIMGIWAPPQQQLPYLQQVAAATEQALEQAFLSARPATLAWSTADVPWIASETIARGNTQEGWPPDGSMFALWARDASTGATIATYVEQPGYPNIVNGDQDLISTGSGEPHATLLSTDFPAYAQDYIEQRLGGLALVASGTFGMQPGPAQDDYSPSPDLPDVTLPTGSYKQTRGFDDEIHMGELIGNLTMGMLGRAHLVRSTTLGSAEQYVLAPVTGPVVAAGIDVAPVDGGTPWADAGLDSQLYPIDRSTAAPYQVSPATVGTWVTGERIGDLLLLSEPGEFSPSVHQTWDQAISGTDATVVLGMTQDQLGYNYPAYTFPFVLWSADEQIFNPSLTLGDQVTTAGEQVAQSLGFQSALTDSPETTATGNDYTAITKPGVQFLPYPLTGDISASSGSFAPLLESFATAPRYNTGVAMGPYTWTFGDGTTGTSPAGTPADQPWFAHAYTSPGRYPVTTMASDGQASAQMTLTLTAYPGLSVAIQRQGARYTAVVSGGSGSVLVYRWTLPDGSSAYGPTVTSPPGSGPLTVTVTDSTGTMASASSSVGQALGARAAGVAPPAGSATPARTAASSQARLAAAESGPPPPPRDAWFLPLAVLIACALLIGRRRATLPR